MRRALLIALSVVALISLGIGIAGTYAAFEQNAMYEFCIDNIDHPCVTNWSYLLIVAFSWFAHYFIPLAAIVFLVWGICWFIVRKRIKKHL